MCVLNKDLTYAGDTLYNAGVYLEVSLLRLFFNCMLQYLLYNKLSMRMLKLISRSINFNMHGIAMSVINPLVSDVQKCLQNCYCVCDHFWTSGTEWLIYSKEIYLYICGLLDSRRSLVRNSFRLINKGNLPSNIVQVYNT